MEICKNRSKESGSLKEFRLGSWGEAGGHRHHLEFGRMLFSALSNIYFVSGAAVCVCNHWIAAFKASATVMFAF